MHSEIALYSKYWWHAVNLQARNPILLRSYRMALLQKSTLLNAVVNKGRRVFGNRSTQSLPGPGDLHSATNPFSSLSRSQQKFKKSNDARHDMSVLAMTYILQDNPTTRELIRLIIGLNDHDDSGEVCTTCNPWQRPQAKGDILSSLRSLPFPSHSQSNSHPSTKKIHLKHQPQSQLF